MITDRLPKDGMILCAVSGGVDSMYLLCRLRELGFIVAAAHYHHGLRGAEADRDETFVRSFCEEQSIPCCTERGDAAAFARENRMGIEEAARILRYGFLERAADQMDAAVIATAHTADDNAETILLHLARGAGLRGLCGIPPVRGRIVRPMLDVTREEAEAYLQARGIPHVEDSTNAGDGYARNRIRHTVIPSLRTENPRLAETLSRTARLLREDESYLAERAETFIADNLTDGSLPGKALAALPKPVASRVVRRMAGEISSEHVEAILHIAAVGGTADVPGMRVVSSAGRIVFGATEQPRLRERIVRFGEPLLLEEAGIVLLSKKINECPTDVYKSFNTFYFKCENICGNITVSARKPGDRFLPVRRGCAKTLKQLFLERGIPAWERDTFPVLRDDRGILGVFGLAAAERVCAKPGDMDILRIQRILLDSEEGDRIDASGHSSYPCE